MTEKQLVTADQTTLTAKSYQILVMVGTHHLPFNRLINWVVKYAQNHPEQQIICQHGETEMPTALPANLTAVVSLTGTEMEQLQVKQVVLPAGPSLMMEWVRRGHQPIIMPRRPELGEHIDEHQILFSQQMKKTGIIRLVDNETELETALEAGEKLKPKAKSAAVTIAPSSSQGKASTDLTAEKVLFTQLPKITESAKNLEKIAQKLLK